MGKLDAPPNGGLKPISPIAWCWICCTRRRPEHDYHAMMRQPARSNIAVLVAKTPLSISDGQDHATRLRLGLAWRESSSTPTSSASTSGRRGDRFRHGFRDWRCASASILSILSEQFLDGDRIEGDAGPRPRSTARPISAAITPIRQGRSAVMASGSPRPADQGGDQARHRQTREGSLPPEFITEKPPTSPAFPAAAALTQTLSPLAGRGSRGEAAAGQEPLMAVANSSPARGRGGTGRDSGRW